MAAYQIQMLCFVGIIHLVLSYRIVFPVSFHNRQRHEPLSTHRKSNRFTSVLNFQSNVFRDWRKSLAKNFVISTPESDIQLKNDQDSTSAAIKIRSNSKYGEKFDKMLGTISNMSEVKLRFQAVIFPRDASDKRFHL